ncbi:hypothetical protein CFOL_v3_12554 [Cephalotus follicularis]|uniref:Retrovirus-related Pol polyprotein from transposon TNT 1-94 n=1 Tax=Cephalotus follicularis TaxID=3775 RepID=A0A1Q3BMX7_CEPFO|nr:hypothetical protein CFOL_v3_12554 [Cephalotus follicularis]
MLTYRRVEDLQLVGFTDSDFAGCQDDRKSTSGYVFMMAGGAVSCKSAKQTLIASLTMQAEFVACYRVATQAVWFRNFMRTFIVFDFVSRPIRLYCDNSSVVLVINNNKGIIGPILLITQIKYLTIKEKVKNCDVTIEHISTDDMIVNPLTKGLHPCVFERHIASMGLVASWDAFV